MDTKVAIRRGQYRRSGGAKKKTAEQEVMVMNLEEERGQWI